MSKHYPSDNLPQLSINVGSEDEPQWEIVGEVTSQKLNLPVEVRSEVLGEDVPIGEREIELVRPRPKRVSDAAAERFE